MVSIPGDKQLYIPIAFYKGCKVAIKPILESNISLNRSQMLELKKVSYLFLITLLIKIFIGNTHVINLQKSVFCICIKYI